MAEDRVRELERRWRQSGAPADEAALLVERVRTGQLEAARLPLAAHLGHAGAALACGTAPEGDPAGLLGSAERLAWCQRLVERGGLIAGLRLGAEAGWSALDAWEEGHRWVPPLIDFLERPRRALATFDLCLLGELPWAGLLPDYERLAALQDWPLEEDPMEGPAWTAFATIEGLLELPTHTLAEHCDYHREEWGSDEAFVAARLWETWNGDPVAMQLALPEARQWAAGGPDPARERAREAARDRTS